VSVTSARIKRLVLRHRSSNQTFKQSSCPDFVTNNRLFRIHSDTDLQCDRRERTLPVLSLVDPHLCVALTKCLGRLTRDEFFTSFQELAVDQHFKASFRQLIDLNLASVVELNYNDLSVFYRLHDPFSKDARRALFARGGSTNYGVARMFQGAANNADIATFDSLADALSWIDLKPSALTRNLKQWLALELNTNVERAQDSLPRSTRPMRKPQVGSP